MPLVSQNHDSKIEQEELRPKQRNLQRASTRSTHTNKSNSVFSSLLSSTDSVINPLLTAPHQVIDLMFVLWLSAIPLQTLVRPVGLALGAQIRNSIAVLLHVRAGVILVSLLLRLGQRLPL